MWSKRVLRQSGSENKKTKKCRKPSKINGFQHFLFGRSVEVLPYGKIPSLALCEQTLTASLGMRTPFCYAEVKFSASAPSKKNRQPQGLSCSGGIRIAKIPSFALCEQALTASLGMRTPFCYAEVKFSASAPSKKNRQPQGLSVLFWSKCGDSNSRPPVPETGALPTALHLEVFSFKIVIKWELRGGLSARPVGLSSTVA